MERQVMMRMGVDLGGTKIELVALADNGDELFRKRIPTPRNYPGTLDAIIGLVNEAEATLGQKC
jgi:fructokinase